MSKFNRVLLLFPTVVCLLFGLWLADYRFIYVDQETRKLIESYGIKVTAKQSYSKTNKLRRLDTHHDHHEHHDHIKAWMVLEEVDGLKNEDVVVFVETSINFLEETNEWTRIIPSGRTWMRLVANVYVVVADHTALRYNMRHCQYKDYPENTVFSCHNEPKYLLTRTGNPTREALKFLMLHEPELYEHTKYILTSRDNIYWRPDQLLKWMTSMENSKVSSLPIIANIHPSISSITEYKTKNKDSSLVKGSGDSIGASAIPLIEAAFRQTKAIHEKCPKLFIGGEYHPLVLNKVAAEKLKNSITTGEIEKQAFAFKTNVNTAIGIMAWIFGFYHATIPGFEENRGNKGVSVLKPTYLAVGGVQEGDSDDCTDKKVMLWPFESRIDQSLVVGCGDIDHPDPMHDKNTHLLMYDCWEYFRDHGEALEFKAGESYHKAAKVIIDSDTNAVVKILGYVEEGQPAIEEPKLAGNQKVEIKDIPYLHKLTGYEKTNHYATHKADGKFDPVTPENCN